MCAIPSVIALANPLIPIPADSAHLRSVSLAHWALLVTPHHLLLHFLLEGDSPRASFSRDWRSLGVGLGPSEVVALGCGRSVQGGVLVDVVLAELNARF